MGLLSQQEHSKAYRDNECFWGTTPNQYVRRLPEIIPPPAQVLDLGVGEGRNALFLTQLGYSVTGVDICDVAIGKLRRTVPKGLTMKAVVADITQFEFEGLYDVIISNAVLQLVDGNEIQGLIERIQQHTKPGGINLLTVFSDTDPARSTSPNLTFFSEEQLKGHYTSWNLITLEHYIKRETHGQLHEHDFLALIAQK